MSTNHNIELYTDGSCQPNPGTGGLGYIIKYIYKEDDKEIISETNGSRGFRSTTNNRMEILAGILGLEKVLEGIVKATYKDIRYVNVMSDSQYFCNAIAKGWIHSWFRNDWFKRDGTPVKNRDLWTRMMDLLDTFRGMGIRVYFHHVKGHADNKYNILADKLATTATKDTDNHEVDIVYENTM